MLCVAKPVGQKDLSAADVTRKRKADLRKTLMRGDTGTCFVLSVLTVCLVVYWA